MLWCRQSVNNPAKRGDPYPICQFLTLNGIIGKCISDNIAKCGFSLFVGNCDWRLIAFASFCGFWRNQLVIKAGLPRSWPKMSHIRRCQLANWSHPLRRHGRISCHFLTQYLPPSAMELAVSHGSHPRHHISSVFRFFQTSKIHFVPLI